MDAAVNDRRTARRSNRIAEHGIVRARVTLGHEASVVDVSTTGALIETHHRLLPGMTIELYMETGEHRRSIRGAVVRCTVTQLHAGALWYRSAIAFDRPAAWLDCVTNDEFAGGNDELDIPSRASRVSTNYPGRGSQQGRRTRQT